LIGLAEEQAKPIILRTKPQVKHDTILAGKGGSQPPPTPPTIRTHSPLLK
jgi:hypothetical protein